MTSKLALHFQQLPGWAGNTAAAWVKVMEPPSENRWPGKKVIGRCYTDDSNSNRMIARGVAGAEEWFQFCQPFFAKAPYVYAWEGPNEPQPVANLGFTQKLGEFTTRLAELMHGQGLKLIGGCLSEGNPGGDEAQRKACFQAIAQGLQHCDYWSQHCYWVLDYPHPEAGMNDWHAFHYRMNKGYADEAGISLPPLLITECGVDGGIVGMPRRGWKTFCRNAGVYLSQLSAFDTELAKDTYVLAATIFTAGPSGDWQDFEISEGMSQTINTHINNAGGPYNPATSLKDMLASEFSAQFEDISATLPKHPTLTYDTRPLGDIDYMVLHHTAVSRATSWEAVASYHVNSNGWPGIAYHIGIRKYGDVKVSLLNTPQTRSYHAHTEGNNHGLAICVAGDFSVGAPTNDEVDAIERVAKVVREWATWNDETQVLGHGQVPGNTTECPGNGLIALLPQLNAQPVPPIGNTMLPDVFDTNGVQKDWDWLRSRYGNVQYLDAGNVRKFKLARIDCTVGPATLQMRVINEDGVAVAHQPVANHWPDPALPDLRNQGLQTLWRDRAASQYTDGNGQTGFGLGSGSYIGNLEEGGPHVAWVLSPSLPSDGLSGIGMLGGTNHEGPLYLTFAIANPSQSYATLEEALYVEAQAHQVIEFNPDAALQKVIERDGYNINSDEFELVFDGVTYVEQRAEHLGTGKVRAYYCVKGDWANVQHIEW